MQNGVSSTLGVLTVEVDLDTVSDGQTPPPPLGKAAAEQLGWTMAQDLQRMLGNLDDFGLIVLGGLYDMTELLQPGLPLVDVLSELYGRSMPDARFQPHLITIGAQGEAFPIPEIAPRRRPGSGPLFVIPFLFQGEADAMDALSANMEKKLLEKGQASANTGRIVQTEFGVRPLNLSYATFNDLCALLKIQLDNNGFSALWTLLDAALFPGHDPVRVQLKEGNLFLLDHGVAYTRHMGFDEWAARFSEEQDALPGYGAWQRLQRQYTAGLGAHGVEVRTVPGIPKTRPMETLPTAPACALAQQNMLAPDADRAQEVVVDAGHLEGLKAVSLVEHRLPGVGVVAYTITARASDGSVLFKAHEFPLLPGALRSIPESWRELAAKHGIELDEATPGTLVHTGQPPELGD